MRPLLIAIFVIIITLSIAATPNAHIPVAVMDDSMPTMPPPLDKE